MNFVTILYNLILMPLEQIFEFVFAALSRVFETPFISLVGLSLIVNLLCLPLYKRADAIQMEENDRQKAMAGWVSHIKSTFKGDERYMMLNTYYRQQGYKPFYSLRSSISLLLQIPFFMVAYRFLSNLDALKGASFWIFQDLGAPDQLLSIGSFTINVLPILMTILNVASAFIYLRGLPVSQKIQTYALAAVFLVLLYNSPSGLVIYWTFNQIFSLLKNVFMKLVKNRMILRTIVSAAGLAVFLILLLAGKLMNPGRLAAAIVLALLCQIPLLLAVFGRNREVRQKKTGRARYLPFFLGCLFLTLFQGMVIPMSVISSSATEFQIGNTTPLSIILNNLCIYAGFFMIWFHIFYFLSSETVRRVFSCFVLVLSGISIVNYFFFGKGLGSVTADLVFEEEPVFPSSEILINSLILAALIAVLILAAKKWIRFIPYLYIVLLACALGMIITNWVGIERTLVSAREIKQQEEVDQTIYLSGKGPNVIIFELDRAVNAFIPYILQEKPELREVFTGFVYYPNTISFGQFTNFGVPAVYGGYEYRPSEMDKRVDESLQDKHNEALLVMPAIFSENGFHVTIINPPYAGDYRWTSNVSIYDAYDNVTAYAFGTQFLDDVSEAYNQDSQSKRTHNFFYYSILKSFPVILQEKVYDEGNYFSVADYGTIAISETFLEGYGELEKLEELTRIDDALPGAMLMLNNNTTHAPVILDPETYEPSVLEEFDIYADNDRFVLETGESLIIDSKNDIIHYDVNMAAILKVADYITFLKDKGIYDQCVIILCADHGRNLGEIEELLIDKTFDAQTVNPLLMIKKLHAQGPFETSYEFMTNADVPVFAMEDVIDHPVNPFTGKVIDNHAKYEEEMLVTNATTWDVDKNRGNVFDIGDAGWYTVKDNIFIKDNWEKK